MKILITGANGYIGSNLAAALSKQSIDVKALVRKTSDLKSLKDVPVELVYGDITDSNSLDEALQSCELVIHTAGAVTDWGPKEYFNAHNVEGLKNVTRAAHAAGAKRLVHISTVAIYGFNVKNATEDFPKPDSQVGYTITKLAGSKWLTAFAAETPMEIVQINPGNVFGPGDEKFIKAYLDVIVKNQFVFVNGGLSATCPTYIENLVHGIILAVHHPQAAGKTFNITDGLDINWRTFTNAFYLALGKKPILRSVPYGVVYALAHGLELGYQLFGIEKPPLLTRYRIDNAGKDYHFSIEKAINILGYQPVIDFDTAVRRTTEWYKNLKPK